MDLFVSILSIWEAMIYRHEQQTFVMINKPLMNYSLRSSTKFCHNLICIINIL